MNVVFITEAQWWERVVESENDLFNLGEGCVTDTERGVVCPRYGGVAFLGVEDITEVGGAGTHAAVNNDVAVHVKGRDGGLEVLACCVDGDCVGCKDLVVEFAGCTAGEEEVDRFDDLSATECGNGLSCNYFALIGVVVEDAAVTFCHVFSAECAGNGFCNTVCKAVRVADAFALDEFDFLFFNRSLGEMLDADISLHFLITSQSSDV